MNIKANTLIIIPTYNESKNIKQLIEEILSLEDHLAILVVDDNSPDGTGEIVDRLCNEHSNIYIIHQKERLGIGKAYKKGFYYALGLNYHFDYIFEMDGDLSHLPQEILAFLEEAKGSDMVIGSRYIDGGRIINWPLGRLVLSYVANLYTRLITGLKLHDCTSGFKCFRRDVLEKINLDNVKSDGYAFQIEMTYICQKRGYTISEIPITFVNRNSGKSKLTIKHVIEAIFIVWKLRFQNLFKRK